MKFLLTRLYTIWDLDKLLGSDRPNTYQPKPETVILSMQINPAIELRALAVRSLTISTKNVKPPCNSAPFLLCLYDREALPAIICTAGRSGQIKPRNLGGGSLWAMTF